MALNISSLLPPPPRFFSVFLLLLLFPSVLSTTPRELKTLIVRVLPDAKPSIFPTHTNWYESSLAAAQDTITNSVGPADKPSSSILHTYDTVFHGFSAQLTASQAQHLQSMPGILGVVPEQVRRLQTTRSPEFLGLRKSDSAGLLKESDYGSDLVIGVIDTGIWPERERFDDRVGRWDGSESPPGGFQGVLDFRLLRLRHPRHLRCRRDWAAKGEVVKKAGGL